MTTIGPALINDLARHTQALEGEIKAAVTHVIDSGWFVLGPETTAFEQEFAAFCGVSHAIGVANGTDALELGLKAVGVVPGDRVATVANAGGYGLHAILACNAEPAFVDIDKATMNMSPDDLARVLERAPEPRVRTVIFTHLYGSMRGIDAVAALCARRGIALVEDCAQAHGAVTDSRIAGSWGQVGCFSFYPTKNLGALGDGGAVVTSDAAKAEHLRQLRQYGWTEKYVAGKSEARNSRLDELQAAVLRAKLRHLPDWNQRRRQIARQLSEHFAGLPIELAVTPDQAAKTDYVAHLYVIRTTQRDALRAHLKANGIGCDIHYPIPDHRQAICPPAAARRALPVTDEIAGKVLTLPCYPEMTDGMVSNVASVVRRWAEAK